MNYWLMKSEPAVFGIDALAAAPRQTTAWDGVRNCQVRNLLRDEFRRGDRAFFWHSSCAVPGIYGTLRVVRGGYPEPAEPRWYQVDVRLLRRFARPVTLSMLRQHADGSLRDLCVLRRGNRLSITPVTSGEWHRILELADHSTG